MTSFFCLPHMANLQDWLAPLIAQSRKLFFFTSITIFPSVRCGKEECEGLSGFNDLSDHYHGRAYPLSFSYM